MDYWDYLGWKYPYDSRAATDRQHSYARALPSSVYTPQVVINGSFVPDYAGDDTCHRPCGALHPGLRAGRGRCASRSVQHPPLTRYRCTRTPRGRRRGRSSCFSSWKTGWEPSRLPGRMRVGACSTPASFAGSRFFPPPTGDARVEIPDMVQSTLGRGLSVSSQDSMHDADNRGRPGAAACPGLGAAHSLPGYRRRWPGGSEARAMVQACSGSICIPAFTDGSGGFSFDGLAPGRDPIAVSPSMKAVEVTVEIGRPVVLGRPDCSARRRSATSPSRADPRRIASAWRGRARGRGAPRGRRRPSARRTRSCRHASFRRDGDLAESFSGCPGWS